MLEWSDIAIFLAVAEEGSLSGAARALKMSQPTVGRRLNALEARLGSTLFVRSSRGLALTEVGAVILENARRMNTEALAIERAAEGRNRGLAGPVTVSVVEGLSHLWLIPQLGAFQARYPDIVVRVRVEDQAADLVQREADIALRLFRPVQNSLIARRMGRILFGFYAASDYLERHGRPKSLEELAEHRRIVSEIGAFERERSTAFRNPPDVPGAPVFVSNSPQAALTATCSGLGIGVHAVAWAGAFDGLERVLPGTSAGEVDIWLVTHEELKTSARIRAMFDFLAERLAADAPIFSGDAPPRWPALGHGLGAAF